MPLQLQLPAHRRRPAGEDEDSLTDCCNSCDRLTAGAFGWFGWKAATFPWAFIGFACFVATMACMGFGEIEMEASREALYTPYSSDLHSQLSSIVTAGLGDPHVRRTTILMQHESSDGANIFTPAYLNAVLDVRTVVLSTQVEVDNTTYSFSDLCVHGTALGAAYALAAGITLNSRASECMLESVGDYWDNSRTALQNDTDLADTVFESTGATDATGRPIRLVDVVAEQTYDNVTGASAFQLSLWLLQSSTVFSSSEVPRDPIAEAWEAELATQLAQLSYSTYTTSVQSAVQSTGVVYSTSFDGLDLTLATPNQYREEINSAHRSDRALIILCYFAVWIYCIIAYFRRNYIRSRMGMSVVAVLMVALSLASGVGACAGLGLEFNTQMLLVSFLLLAVGLGDAGILMACIQPFSLAASMGGPSATPFELSSLASHRQTRFWWIRSGELEGVAPTAAGHDVSSEAAISAGTAAAGPFITAASACISFSLLLGAFTVFPSFRSFCITAAVSIIFLWIYCMFFFVPCLALDARRQAEHRCDVPCCCCPTIKHGVEEKLCHQGGEIFDESDSSLVGSLLGSPLVEFLFTRVGTAACLIAFLALLGAAVYGCTTVTVNLSSRSSLLLPRHNSFADQLVERDSLFTGNTQKPCAVYATQADEDYFGNMDALDTLNTEITNNAYILSSTVRYWWRDYLTFISSTSPWNSSTSLVLNGRPVSSAVFQTSLYAFLITDDGTQYWNDIIPLGASSSAPLGGGIRASKVEFRLASADTTSDAISVMRSLHASVPTSSSSGLDVFVWSTDFYLLESQHELVWMVVRHMLLAGAVIIVVATFLLANVWAACIVTLGCAVVCAEVVGILALASEPLLCETAHGLLLVPMLAAWIFVHETHGFLRCVGTRTYRARKVLQRMGGCLVDFIVVLLLSVIFLAAARTTSYYSAFTTLALTAALFVLNALAMLPIVLAAVGPRVSWPGEIQLAHDATVDLHARRPVDKRSDEPHVDSESTERARTIHTNSALEMQALVDAHAQQHDDNAMRPRNRTEEQTKQMRQSTAANQDAAQNRRTTASGWV